MSGRQMPIFTKTFDFITWLLPATNHFPRAHRHTFTERLLKSAFNMRESLTRANMRRGNDRIMQLRLADEELANVREYIRMTVEWGWLTPRKYRHVAGMIDEIGRLLGGWMRVNS